MSKVFPCPHCQSQNFATQTRLRQAEEVPLACWKCGKEINCSGVLSENRKGRQKNLGKKGRRREKIQKGC